ncbi:MAG: hypothetical protein RIR12_2051 [Bacteroidota bacterium]|jgi:hypothetical protein
MKCIAFAILLFASIFASAQQNFTAIESPLLIPGYSINNQLVTVDEKKHKKKKEIKLYTDTKWRMNQNKFITGALVFIAGSAKGFNEGLQFNYFGFESIFPKANDQWFYPGMSFKNKYKEGNPEKGPKFPLSTSILVMFTDQYHLNNFIQRSALTAALVIKIGNGKKPLKHYLFDALYYTACYQAGFHSIYYPIKARSK